MVIRAVTRVLSILKNIRGPIWALNFSVANLVFMLAVAGMLLTEASHIVSASSVLPVSTPTVHAAAPAVSSKNSPGPIIKNRKPASKKAAAQKPAVQTASIQTTPPSAPCVPEGRPGLATLNPAPSTPGFYHRAQPVHHFRVYGNTSAEIYNQVSRCGPLFSNGQRYSGAAAYNVTWNFRKVPLAGNPEVCKLTDISITAHTKITLPYWQPSAHATSQAVSYWQNAYAQLAAHEAGHVDIVVNSALRTFNKLQKLTPSSCNGIITKALTLVGQDRASLDRQQINYDQATNHGLRL